jgi:hypothetical protein
VATATSLPPGAFAGCDDFDGSRRCRECSTEHRWSALPAEGAHRFTSDVRRGASTRGLSRRSGLLTLTGAERKVIWGRNGGELVAAPGANPGEPLVACVFRLLNRLLLAGDVASRVFFCSPATCKARRHHYARTQSPSSGRSCHRPRCGGRRHRTGAVLSSSLPSRSQRHRFALQHSGRRNCELQRCRPDQWDAILRAWPGNSRRQRCAVPTRWLRASGFAKRQWCLPCHLPCPCLNPTGHLQRRPPVWRRARWCLYLPHRHEVTGGDTHGRYSSNYRLAPRKGNDRYPGAVTSG